MKILIVSQYFWPENFRVNDLALALHKRGHEVHVLTGKPNYPFGKIFKGYTIFPYSKEMFNDIRIYRVPIVPRGKGTNFQLAMNYFSFVFFSCIHVLFSFEKYDITLTFAISPITQVFAALTHKWLYKSRTYIWVQDLWPESVSAASKISSSFIIKGLNRMVGFIYKHSDKVLVQSEAFMPLVIGKGVTKKQLEYVPNWAEDIYSDNTKVVKEKFFDTIPKGFNIMFAGNIGEAQDFASILKAAELTKKYSEINWIIIGDGRKKPWVEHKINQKGLQETVFLLGQYPMEDMPNFFIHANIMLLSLKNDEIFSMTIPSKLQSYMAFGKPVLGILNGIGAEIIKTAKCGLVCNAEDFTSLANNVLKAYNDSTSALSYKGENGKRYYQKYFSKDVILSNMEKIFQP